MVTAAVAALRRWLALSAILATVLSSLAAAADAACALGECDLRPEEIGAALAVGDGPDGNLQLLQFKADALASKPRKPLRVVEEPSEEDIEENAVPEPQSCDAENPCKKGMGCATKADKSYSQCVPCSQTQFQRDCASWDNELRLSAVKVCGKPCTKKPPVPPCMMGTALPEYNKNNCLRKTDGSMTMTCSDANPDSCGTRLGSDRPAGEGRYSVSMKAAPGVGVATTFYLYTFGEDNHRANPWNEVDIEILGKMAGAKKSLIWTNFFTGPFNSSAPIWKRQEEHPKYIEVPFDVTANFHEYAIHVGDGTYEWLVDGVTYRSENVREYPDVMETIQKAKFRTYLALWGQNATSGSWSDMGYLDDRLGGDFPLKASYKDVQVPEGPQASS